MLRKRELKYVKLERSLEAAIRDAAKLICINKYKSVFIVREERTPVYGAFSGNDRDWLFGGYEGKARRVILHMNRNEFGETFKSVIDVVMAH